MNDLDKALADLGDIRQRLATGAMFRGFGPLVMALTGVLAFAAAGVQIIWPETFAASAQAFMLTWIGVAVLACAAIGIEMIARTKRHHGGLADVMLFNAVEHFFPVGAAGAAITAILWRSAPDTLWLLPGLWAILVALGLFATHRFLPRTIAIVAAWYFIAGAAAMLSGAETQMLSPLAMGLTFGIGQLLLAGVLRWAYGPEPARSRTAEGRHR